MFSEGKRDEAHLKSLIPTPLLPSVRFSRQLLSSSLIESRYSAGTSIFTEGKLDGGVILLSRAISRSTSISGRAEGDRIFSASVDERNELPDEEALLWAVLEKLPIYDRVSTGFSPFSDGDPKQIDAKQLSLPEWRRLLERLLKPAEKDHERFLLKLKERIARSGRESKWRNREALPLSCEVVHLSSCP